MLLVDLAFDTINHELIIVKYMHMAFLLISVDDKKSRTIQFSVLGLSYYKELHKEQSLVPHWLIFTSMIYFSVLGTLEHKSE